jgi:SAM-dependent methyltransferase
MQFFDNAYEGTPTWDIGRPQGAIVRLASAGFISGPVLDVGCGTGENALYLASLGHEVLGIDLARAAIEKARAKAVDRAAGDRVEFLVWDALHLGDLGRRFETAIDSGLFHCLAPEQRGAYSASLGDALRPGGRAHLLCWSTRNRLGYGPERIRKSDIRASFRSGWSVEAIEEETLDSLLPARLVHAWLARIRRARE